MHMAQRPEEDSLHDVNNIHHYPVWIEEKIYALGYSLCLSFPFFLLQQIA